jgi:hypothetical protein
MQRILFVTGASGAGKTALVSALEARALPGVRCWHAEQSSPREWIDRVRDEPGVLAVLDGEVRPTEALAAARQAGLSAAALLVEHGHESTSAAYLRGQADALQLPIIDTVAMSAEQAIETLVRHAKALAG